MAEKEQDRGTGIESNLGGEVDEQDKIAGYRSPEMTAHLINGMRRDLGMDDMADQVLEKVVANLERTGASEQAERLRHLAGRLSERGPRESDEGVSNELEEVVTGPEKNTSSSSERLAEHIADIYAINPFMAGRLFDSTLTSLTMAWRDDEADELERIIKQKGFQD